ncbi:MAG: thioredoxin family protein [Betaproteobacteria bacterium]|nr:thioredoxin family protein [Betaproteobacteria bacterium]MBI3057579.1 thioredoxin family protein [Betaproteobacteria bacterium]
MREALHFFLYDTPKGIELKLEKVEQIQDIMTYGVMSTPGVVIDGKVVHAGGVPSRGAVDSNQDASGVLGGYFSRVNREPRRNLAILVPAAQYRAPRRGLH